MRIDGQDERLEGFRDGRVGQALPLVAMAPQHRSAVPFGSFGQFFGQPGLADAGVSGDEAEATPPGECLRPPTTEAPEFGVAAHHRVPLRRGGAGRGPVPDRKRRDGVGHTVEVLFPDVAQAEGKPAGEQADDDVGTEDLARLRPLAELSGDDGGQFGGACRGLRGGAGVEGEPDRRGPERLVNGGGRERGHEVVAECLEQAAAVLGDDRPDQVFMVTPASEQGDECAPFRHTVQPGPHSCQLSSRGRPPRPVLLGRMIAENSVLRG